MEAEKILDIIGADFYTGARFAIKGVMRLFDGHLWN